MTVSTILQDAGWVPEKIAEAIVVNDLGVTFHPEFINHYGSLAMRCANKNDQHDDYMLMIKMDFAEKIKFELRKVKIEDLDK